jgi:hypothetical protein
MEMISYVLRNGLYLLGFLSDGAVHGVLFSVQWQSLFFVLSVVLARPIRIFIRGYIGGINRGRNHHSLPER